MNILYFSDADPLGSGYWTICQNLSTRLAARGHNVVVLGLGHNNRTPHNYPFRLVPTDHRVLRTQVETIKQAHWPDVLVFANDIPYQVQFTEWFAGKGTARFVGLYPVEAGPLAEIGEWVQHLQLMDKGLVISEFGQAECVAAGLQNTTFLPVGIDSTFWHPPSQEYREELRRDLGLDGKFVVLTVAANHFRKNLAAAIQIIAEARSKYGVDNIHHLLIAQPTPKSLGWSLQELAARYGVSDCVTVIHSRPDNELLLRFYQASDAYLCTSHAEGLGLPLLEAMACGVPCVAGNWTAMGELLADGRGYLVDAEYWFDDPFGNNRRAFISVDGAAAALAQCHGSDSKAIVAKAEAFAQTRTFDHAADVFLAALS